jgi:hypothetical protein
LDRARHLAVQEGPEVLADPEADLATLTRESPAEATDRD